MKIKHTLLFICFCAISLQGISQENTLDDRDPVAMLKASFIFNFAYMSEWPVSDIKTSNFIIGVYGDRAIFNHMLEKYSTQPIGNRIVKIKYIKNLSDVSNVQILFVDDSKIGDIYRLTRILNNRKCLIVTENPNGLGLGATFNFVTVDSKTRYEISLKKVKKENIIISSTLKDWAVKLVE